ncbi:MAG: Peptidoglycan glycosyltransferase, partial [Frankiales bacterium]|nr:Peptidoglycan glycosyltransferase [Frankiales bacterium]
MSDPSRPRVVILSVVVFAILATLLGRLWVLQVYDRASYVEQAASNRTRDVVTPAPRGEVYDSSGRPLIQNRTAMVVKVNRSVLRRQDDDGAAVLRRLVPVVDLTFEELAARTTPCGEKLPDGRKATSSEDGCWVGSPYQPIPVATFDARDTAALGKVLIVEENREDFPGITADFEAVREYPGGTLAAHTLGYLGPISEREVGTPGYEGVQDSALVGRSGVEQTYEKQLRGKDGVETLLVDKDGSVTGTASTTAPTAGDKLVLSIDAGVQAIAERELQAAILNARTRPYYADETKNLVADSGSVVVMEARTGRIVALASYPSYDPALFTGGIDETTYTNLVAKANGEPLLFRATQGAYAPASTFKAVTTAAVVMNGQSTFNTVSDCPATFAPLGDKRNFEGRSQGALSLRVAIVKSCDTNFYKFAYDEWVADGRLNPVPNPKDPIINMALAFGLGQKTGIDLPGEITGTIPTRQWRKDIWSKNKGEYCKGAQNPAFDAQHRKDDQAYCDEGWRFQGGQAANFAIGQGETLVTPLQLASVYATVANGGQVLKPTVARGLLSADGRTVTDFAPTVKATVPVSPEVLAGLRDALHGVTTEPGGTGTNTFAGLPLSVAGKTGTGEVNGKQDTSWFASFAPADNPQLVVVGMVSQGGTGATTAAPLVRKVYEGIYGL